MLLFFGRILCTPNVRNPNLICINYPKEGKREEKGEKYNWEEIARTQYGKMGAGNSRGWVRDILRNFWAGMCITVHTLWEEEEKGLRGVFKVPCRLTSNYKKRRREEREWALRKVPFNALGWAKKRTFGLPSGYYLVFFVLSAMCS